MHVQTQLTTRVSSYFPCVPSTCPSKTSADLCNPERFVLKTKEQRAAEKALMDKSPLKTLTLEDFLESERHKLTGTLTPVTAETFAKWKKERMDKRAAEDEARKAKEATGRAMFESGDWESSENESEDDEDEGAEDEGEDSTWNLEVMRRETERLRAKKEEDRLHGTDAGASGRDGDGGEGGDEERVVNGVDDHGNMENGVNGNGSNGS